MELHGRLSRRRPGGDGRLGRRTFLVSIAGAALAGWAAGWVRKPLVVSQSAAVRSAVFVTAPAVVVGAGVSSSRPSAPADPVKAIDAFYRSTHR